MVETETSNMHLTPRQFACLKVINQSIHKRGVCPSFDEIALKLNLKSRSAVHRLIASLEERGYIAKKANRSRTLEILRLPKSLERYKDNISNSNKVLPFKNHLHNYNESKIKLVGRIAAGLPIEALNEYNDELVVPKYLTQGANNYALKVEGDSMINAGIYPGDIVVVSQNTSPTPGKIVVALIDMSEATLKYYYPNKDNIELKAANPSYSDITLDHSRLEIQGCLVGLLRNY